jgi:hypothetical protein
VRKSFFILSLALLFVGGAVAAETLTMTDGSSQAGDIVKFDDNGLLLRMGDNYTNLPWGRFSQESLKQLAANPKLRPLVEVFIDPDSSSRPPKPEIKINAVTRLERPAHPSLFGGLFVSPVGWFLVLVLYLANLYAAFEVSVIRARPSLQVVGLAAVLPVIGPVIFLALPIKVEAPPVEAAEAAPEPTRYQASSPEIQITEASWQSEGEKKPEGQVYARGKYTFNKRFVETRFAAFVGATPGDLAQKFAMEVKTMKDHFAVQHIVEVTATDVIFQIVGRGPVPVPLADILEIKLNPKAA